jgi:GTPase SAR1 family protein
VLEKGDLQEWGRVKLMIVGEGRAGKTSTVRSLLGLAPTDTESTKGIDLKVTRAADWKERCANESDFDQLARRAAASRAKSQLKSTATPPIPPKKSSFTAAMGETIRNSLQRFSLSKSSVEERKRLSLPPQERVPVNPPKRKLVEDCDVAKRFDFEAVKLMTTKTESGSDVSFSIWDYGGQEVFYTLHHIFLSKVGVYMVVFDMKKLSNEQTKASALEFVEFWLNSVKLHSPDAPIIIVGTRGDEISSPEQHDAINRVLRDKIKMASFKVMPNDDGGRGLYFFPVDNCKTSPTRLAHLRSVVQKAALELPSIHQKVPLAWLKILDDLVMSKKQYESLDNVVELAAEYGVSANQTKEMLRVLHELGVLVHQRATERLFQTVVLEPQWLLNKLAAVINDERHSQATHFDEKLRRLKLGDVFAEYRKSGVATRELLEFLWDNNQVDYLVDFMKETMLLCDFKKKGQKMFLVTSLMVQDREDEPLDIDEFNGGLSCVLDFSNFFLPKGVFQRLVSTCASFGFQEPELSRHIAVVHLKEDPVALIEEKKQIRIRLLPNSEGGSKSLQLLISMFREQCEQLMKNLPWKLLLQLPENDQVYVDYQEILDARKAALEKVKPCNSRKQVEVSRFDVFFEDESVGRLDSDGEGQIVPNCRLKKLVEGCKYHVFISHSQATAADMANVIASNLMSRGLKPWYDQNVEGNLGEPEMRKGIQESKCYLLLLTQGVFERPAVKMELETALRHNKSILLVHESQTNLNGFSPFSEYLNSCPDSVKHLFKETESMPMQRRRYLAVPFYEELIKRIDRVVG